MFYLIWGTWNKIICACLYVQGRKVERGIKQGNMEALKEEGREQERVVRFCDIKAEKKVYFNRTSKKRRVSTGQSGG